VIVIASETVMSIRRVQLNTTFVQQYLQGRRALLAGTSGRRLKRVQRQAGDKRAVEAVTHAIRGGKA